MWTWTQRHATFDEKVPLKTHSDSEDMEKFDHYNWNKTAEQKRILTNFFEANNTNPSRAERDYLAQVTELTESTVKDWFYNCRRSRLSLRPELSRCPREHSSQNMKSADRLKRDLTAAQKNTLKQFFSTNNHPTQAEADHLAEITGLTAELIINWWHNRQYPSSKFPPEVSIKKHKRSTDVDNIGGTHEVKMSLYFKTNKYPSNTELLDVINKTGLKIRRIKTRFNKEGCNLGGAENLEISDTSRKVGQASDKTSTCTPSSDGKDPGAFEQFAGMGIRKRFATLKELSMTDLKHHIRNCEPLVFKLFAIFAKKMEEEPSFQVLVEETNSLAPVLIYFNPFNYVQILEIKEWQCILFQRILQVQKCLKWKNILSTYGPLVLDVWVPIFVYSGVLRVSITEAVQELYQLSRQRTTQIPKRKHWIVPTHLETCQL